MITLVSDDVLLRCEVTRPTDGQSVLRFRYNADAGPFFVYSPWQLLREGPSPEWVARLVDPVFIVQDNWATVGPQTACEFFRMRRNEPSHYPLPGDVFARTATIFDRLWRAQADLSDALRAHMGAGEYCELLPEPGQRIMGTKYVYRHMTLWSSRRTLTRDQWIALIDRLLAKDEMVLSALTGGDAGTPEITNNRFISIEVRREVWRRDQGKCVNCGSQQRLEFDHMIPVAMGGANTARNVCLLCETCNRTKGASLG